MVLYLKILFFVVIIHISMEMDMGMNITGGQGGATALFSSTEGPQTGCSRATTSGSPGNSAVSAAAGGAGEMYVGGEGVPIQKGGVGYSADLKPVLASTGGHAAGYQRYEGEGMRSDLNQYARIPAMTAGSKKRFHKRMTRRLRRTANNMGRKVTSFARKGLKSAKKNVRFENIKTQVGSLRKLTNKKYSLRNLRRKYKKSRTLKFSKKQPGSRFKRMLANKGKRAPFFAYGGKKSKTGKNKTGRNGKKMKGGCGCNGGNGGANPVAPAMGGNTGALFMSGGSAGGYDGGSVNNKPLSFGQSIGGVNLSSSALANPPPQASYSKCGM